MASKRSCPFSDQPAAKIGYVKKKPGAWETVLLRKQMPKSFTQQVKSHLRMPDVSTEEEAMTQLREMQRRVEECPESCVEYFQHVKEEAAKSKAGNPFQKKTELPRHIVPSGMKFAVKLRKVCGRPHETLEAAEA